MVNGLWVSGEFFGVLGVPAVVGRTFRDGDDRRGGGSDGPVAVISYAFWQRRYGGVADVVGKPLTLNRVESPFRIVGVTPPGFFGPVVGRQFDVAIPFGTEPLFNPRRSLLDQRTTWWVTIAARLGPGQTIASLTTALRAIQPRVRAATLPENYAADRSSRWVRQPFSLRSAATGVSSLRARYERPLVVLMIIVVMVLLVACANVANLQLARGEARRHELRVRRALGASRFRLARQLLVESVLLATLGAALGLVVARWGSHLLVSQLSTAVSTAFLDLSFNWRLLGFAAVLTVMTAVLFGTVPALRAARTDANEALRDGRSLLGSGRRIVGHTLVVAQVGLSVTLVVAAGLFVRSFTALATLDLGFDTDRVLAVGVGGRPGTIAPDTLLAIFDGVRDGAAGAPGVERASYAAIVPVTGGGSMDKLEVPGAPPLSGDDRWVYMNFISPEWFATFGTPVLAGRDFTARDRAGAPAVVIVNQTLARRIFGNRSPLGRSIRVGEEVQADIVGVVGDAVYTDLRGRVPPTVYIPIAQQVGQIHHDVSILVRSARGSPAVLTRGVVEAIARVDPTLLLSVRTVRDQVDAAMTQERLMAMLAAFFGVLALLLAGIGVFGVTAYAVHRRRAEIGLRMALGASQAGVVRLVLGRVLLLVVAGLVVGGAASFWASRLVKALLFGIEPRDPVTFAGAALVLAVVGLLAAAVPARRASRIDPTTVMRAL
jgi:predicted permease